MGRHICIALIVAVLSLQMGVFAVEFKDVPVTASYYEAVDKLSEKGIIQGDGDGTFRPDESTTRAEFCTFVSRANGYMKAFKSNRTMPFEDVTKKHWAEPFILYCYEKGYINGVEEKRFAPEDKVTCEQAIKIVVSALGVEDLSAVGPMWYSGYISEAKKKGILDDVEYEIGKTASRSFVAQLIYNYVTLKDEDEDINTYFEEYDHSSSQENYKYERPEYVPPITIDYEQQMRDELGIDAEEKETLRYDESSERNIGR